MFKHGSSCTDCLLPQSGVHPKAQTHEASLFHLLRVRKNLVLFHPYVKAAGTRLGVAAAGSGVAQRLGISIESHRIASYRILLSHPPT